MLSADETTRMISEKLGPTLSACARYNEAIASHVVDPWTKARLMGFVDHLRREAEAFATRVERRGPYRDGNAIRAMMQHEIEPVRVMSEAVAGHLGHRLGQRGQVGHA